MVCSTIMNTAGKLSTASLLRTYAYNVLVDNRWDNESFEELVNFTLAFIDLQCKNGSYREPAAAITGSCETALSLWTGDQISREPGLIPHLTRIVIENAEANSKQYNKLAKEFEDMYGNRPSYGYMGSSRDDRSHYRDDRGSRRDPADDWEYDNRNAPRDWLMDRDDVIAYFRDYRREHPRLGHPRDWEFGGRYHWETPRGRDDRGYHHDHSGYGHDGRGYDNRREPAPYRSATQAPARVSSAVESRYAAKADPRNVYSDNGKTPESAYGVTSHRQAPAKPVAAPEPVEHNQQESVQLLEMQGESEMDRNSHKVTVAGVETVNMAADRYSRYAISANAVAKESPKELIKQNEEGKTVASDVKLPGIEIDPTVSLSESLASAILSTRMRLEKAKEENQTVIIRRMVAIARHVTVKTNVKAFRDFLSGSRDLGALADAISSTVSRMNNTSATVQGAALQESKDIIVYMNMVDNTLRDILNHFFHYVCGQTEWNVSDFATGYPSFVEFLKQQGDNDAIRAVNEFSEDILEVLRKFTDEDYDNLEQFFLPEEAENKFHLAMFPICASMTMVDMTSSELGYKVTDDVRMIDPKKQPALYNIVKSAWGMKNVHGLRGYFNLLVTSDNAIYEFFQDPSLNGDFMIRNHHFL